MERLTRYFGLTVHVGLMVVALCALTFLGGCAASGTIAFGEHARAAIAQPACPTAREAVGERKVVVEQRIGHLGPDDVTTTTTTEPALAPASEPVTLQEANGADVGEVTGGIFKTGLRVFGGFFKGLLGLLVP